MLKYLSFYYVVQKRLKQIARMSTPASESSVDFDRKTIN